MIMWKRRSVLAAAAIASNGGCIFAHHFPGWILRKIAITSHHPMISPRAMRNNAIHIRCGGICSIHEEAITSNKLESPSEERIVETGKTYQVYLAVGSNLGNRYSNIQKALRLLGQKVIRTSFLYETAPMYVLDQPPFLNGVVEIVTDLPPEELLRRIKQVESESGRDFTTIRNGPRPIDLDILFVTKHGIPIIRNTPTLTIPHPRIPERDFVLIPLHDLEDEDEPLLHPILNTTIRELYEHFCNRSEAKSPSAIRVLPLPRDRYLYFNATRIMGILNVTPDSFSDGGRYNSVDAAVKKALEMVSKGADVIDIGGESTRPGAREVAIEEELQRTIPVIQAIRKVSDVPLSIDTRHASVAKAAILAGADIVNDVTGGTFDMDMLKTVSELDVPIIIMHMRGTPETMQSLALYEDVVEDVSRELTHQAKLASSVYDIPRWVQIVDPGIGFAKDLRGNLLLLKNIATIRRIAGNVPILLGTSRKGFIGKISGEDVAENRDPGTIASCVAALCLENNQLGCNILRVHNVADCKQAIQVVDAIRNS